MSQTVLATVAPSQVRIWMGVTILTALGALLLYLALGSAPVAPLWRAFLVAVAAAALWAGWRMYGDSGLSLELTETELRDTRGRQIAAVENVASVDRGAFAFKPSHGFLLRLRVSGPRAWVPGVWWRAGRRVAVGGILPGGEAKAMADIISAMVAARDDAA